jgi:hypothetical protein
MKINKYIYIIIFIAVATSCTKMIDLYPESNLNTGTFYRNLQEIDVALTGCYRGMQKTLTEEWQVTELRSDNSIQGVPASQAVPNRDLSDLDMFMPNTSHQGNFLYWTNVYFNIRNINLLLNALNVNYSPSTKTIAYDNLTISISDADRKARAAEAQFIRAYHYFNLVRLYGGVFLIHEPVTPEQAKLTNRSTVADIYALIEADLNSAIANGITEKFTAGSANLGRANIWAAKALLAKVYLTQNKKTEAIALLQDVIANSGYGLQPNYISIFSIANEMSNEVLFAIRYKAGGFGLGSNLPNLFAPLQSGSAVINGDGRGLNYPSTDVLTSYFNIPITNAITTAGSNILTLPAPNPEIRVGMYVSATQVPATATITAINGVTITMSATATATSATANVVIGDPRRTASIATYNPGAKHYPIKLISNPTVANDAENDWIVLRYADVLLMMAEAQGNSTSSIALINQIRTRARLAPLNAADINTTALFEAALARERRNEFAFENQRWFDLLRYTATLSTINAVQAIKDHFTIEYPTHYNGYPAPRLSLFELQNNVTAQKLLLPIPQREIDNNSTIVIPQNPGY